MNSTPPLSVPLSLPYAQASAAQRTQLLASLRQRLRHHFPTLPPAAWLRALFELQPPLLPSLAGATLAEAELPPLVQLLAAAPELPLLDPPIYGRPALELAQLVLHYRELAAAALPEVAPAPGGPRVRALLLALGSPVPLAEQVIQAWRWDLASAPALPPGPPGAGPAPDSAEARRYLAWLREEEAPLQPDKDDALAQASE